jgi:hypothetical protein
MLGGQIGGIASSLAADLDRNFSVTAKTLVEAQAGVKLAESGLDAAVVLHEAAVSLLPQLPPQRQQFLRSHLLLQAAIQRYAVTAISHLANATVTLAAAGSPATSASAQVALADVAAALAAIDALFQAERAAEGSGEWRGLYWADRHRFTNFQVRRRSKIYSIRGAATPSHSGLGAGTTKNSAGHAGSSAETAVRPGDPD